MPTATDNLIAPAVCIEQCVPAGLYLPILINLFGKIAGVSMDTNSLMADARCIDSCIPRGMQLPVLISLVSKIVTGGGSLGNGIVFGAYGGNPPPFTPVGGTGAAFDTDTGRPWFYYNGGWN